MTRGKATQEERDMCKETGPSKNEKERLEREVQRTREQIARLKSVLESELESSRGGEDGDDADVASDIYEREKALALIRILEHKLHALEHALELESKGAYGVCEKCGQAIAPARLEIVPEATLCVKCKADAERAGSPRRKAPPHRA